MAKKTITKLGENWIPLLLAAILAVLSIGVTIVMNTTVKTIPSLYNTMGKMEMRLEIMNEYLIKIDNRMEKISDQLHSHDLRIQENSIRIEGIEKNLNNINKK